MAENISLGDRAKHAAAVTRWKFDQQKRLMDLNNQIGNLQTQIKTLKHNLAETTLALYNEKKLKDKSLNDICDSIIIVYQNVSQLEATKEQAKKEVAPTMEIYGYNEKPLDTFSGLVCPECGDPLKGKFCPKHGCEGVLPKTEKTTDIPTSDGDVLYCPIDMKPLKGKFCTEHGKAGIAKSSPQN